MTRKQLALVLLGWTLFGWLNGTQLFFNVRSEVPDAPLLYWRIAAWETGTWLLWAVLTPLIVWLCRRVPLARRARPILVHLAVSCAIPFVKTAAIIVLTDFTHPFPWEQKLVFWPRYLGGISNRFHQDLIVYWAIVGIVYAIDSRRRLRERELLLAQAQLANLRLQMQPHFLFNTLHTIASLVRNGDSAAAVTMIAGLSDLLRYSLDNAGRDVVPLSEELEVVRRYLEIQQTRFSDQLQVRVEAAPETNDAAVPTMLLQPLVENAIRHGNPRTLDVRTRREGGMLVVEIANDGTPLPRDWREREGVGLSSTRRRLEQLFGGRATLELAGEAQRVLATVRIPFTRELG